MLCLIIGIVSPNGSNEASHQMFSLRYKKNYPHTPSNTPSYLELCSCLDKSKTFIFAVLETQENKLVAQNFYFGPLKFLF